MNPRRAVVTVDHQTCRGLGLCESLLPTHFRLDDHANLDILEPVVEANDVDAIVLAVRGCPTGALRLKQHP